MNQPLKRPLLVEAFLREGRVTGVTHQVDERHYRLVDLLNQTGAYLDLDSVRFTHGQGAEPHFLPSLALAKRAIVAAIPRETREQTRIRQVAGKGMERLTASKQRLAILAPPIYVEGTAYIAVGGGLLRVEDVFPPFFAISSAALRLPDGTQGEVAVVVLNRDHVAGLSRL